MILTEKQKLMIYTIALDSCRIHSDIFGMTREDRLILCNEIANQQNEKLEVNDQVVSILNQKKIE